MSLLDEAMASGNPVFVGIGIVAGLVLLLMRTESSAVAKWLSLRLTRTAVARLPERLRETKSEEWAAELEAMDGSRIARVALSASFVRAANKIAAGQGATGSHVKPIRLAPITLDVDGVLVRLNPRVGAALPDGRILVSFMATYRDGYGTTGKIALPVNSDHEVIQELLAERFVTDGPFEGLFTRELTQMLSSWRRDAGARLHDDSTKDAS